jgi:hypothetical protein
MSNRRIMLGLVACLSVALVLSIALGQNRRTGQRANRNTQMGARGGQRFDPAQMRQMMEQRMKRQLGATDAEWKTLGPQVMKVEQLNRELSGGRGGMAFGGRRAGRGQQPDAQMTALEKASQRLRTTLRNESATPEQIKQELTAFRAAKDKAGKELVAAQQQLRKVVNVRQEAQLVLMGLLG